MCMHLLHTVCSGTAVTSSDLHNHQRQYKYHVFQTLACNMCSSMCFLMKTLMWLAFPFSHTEYVWEWHQRSHPQMGTHWQDTVASAELHVHSSYDLVGSYVCSNLQTSGLHHNSLMSHHDSISCNHSSKLSACSWLYIHSSCPDSKTLCRN